MQATPIHRTVLLFFLLPGLLLCTAPAWAASLLDSVDAALSYSPELKASQEKRQVSGHAVDKAKAGFFPRIAAEAGGGFSQRNDAVTRGHKEEHDARAFGDAGVRLIQPLYQGGHTTADVAARRAQFDAADSQLEDHGASLAFQAIVAHVEVLRRAELVALAKQNVKEHAKILGTVRQRMNGQVSTVGELHQVQGRHARAKATLSSYESALDAANAAYLNATGKAPQKLERVPAPAKSYASLDEALQACLSGSKRIQAGIHDVTAAKEEKDMAQSRFYPSINLEAGPSWYNRDSRRYDSARVTDLSAGLRLKWDLLSGGEDVANVAMAGARIRQARQNVHTTMDALGKDIETTWSLYLSSQEQIAHYETAKRSSRLARDDYYRQFLSAQRNLLDVLDAENDYFYAAGQQAMSQGDRVIAAYRLLALSGDLLPGLGVDPARLRTNTRTTTEDAENLRTAFPTSLRGK
jgi:adhesin transport system outer membrane protein